MATVFPSTALPSVLPDEAATVGRTALGTSAAAIAEQQNHLAQYRFRRAVCSQAYTDVAGGSINTITPLGVTAPVPAVWKCSPRAEVVVLFIDLQVGVWGDGKTGRTLDVKLRSFPAGVDLDPPGYILSSADGTLPNEVSGTSANSLWDQFLVSSGDNRIPGGTLMRVLEIPLANRGTDVAVWVTPTNVRVVSITAVEGFLPAAEQVMV